MERREFLSGSAWMGAVAMAAGCASSDFALGTGAGGSMHGFACAPMSRIRVGVIGLGQRGSDAARRLSTVPGVEVVAICDVRAERLALTQEKIRANGKRAPREYTGAEGWKRLCAADDVDVVYIVTDWLQHAPMAVYAMNAGKHAFMEVPTGVTAEECWEVVETAERRRVHCMLLENCCYGETETLALNLCRTGVLGEITHADCAYIHDLRSKIYDSGTKGYWQDWRLRFNAAHKGNAYPTHGLGPVCWYMNINRGDRLDYLVSLESQSAANPRFAAEALGDGAEDAWKKRMPLEMGDMNTTLVKTVKGRSIMIQHDVSTPRPYTRLNLVQGSKGAFYGMPWRKEGYVDEWRIALDAPGCKGAHEWWAYDSEKGREIAARYSHPMWREAGAIAKLAGGHGGKDFMMDLRWAYCLQNGLPLDIDVYDSATWSVIRDLSERSVRSGSMPQTVPDFTKGGWRRFEPIGDMTLDLAKLALTDDQRALIGRQQTSF